MEYIDYYKILELEKNATDESIKKAYRKLARKYHPDLNPGDKGATKKFQQINEANEVLSDPEKRKKYDQYGKDWQHADQFEQSRQYRESSGSRGQAFSGGFSDENFSDFFTSMFGGSKGGARQAKFRGQDYNAELGLNLSDAFTTHQQTITVDGKNIRITIPAGIQNEQKIRLKGHGGMGTNGGPNGDLYINFQIANHPRFKRMGNDLHTTVKIDLYTALLGGEILVETLSGNIKVKVAPETQNGTKIRLKNKGFPVYKQEGQFGDLYITYQVTLPTGLSDKQKEMFTQLSKM